jgi:hypothetical protein
MDKSSSRPLPTVLLNLTLTQQDLYDIKHFAQAEYRECPHGDVAKCWVNAVNRLLLAKGCKTVDFFDDGWPE